MSIWEPPHEPEGLLKWFLGFLIFLFIVWFFTGGPERLKKEKIGPFVEPPIESNTPNPE